MNSDGAQYKALKAQHNDGAQYKALKAQQDKYVKNSNTCKDSLSFPMGSTVAVQYKEGGPWTHLGH